MDEQLHKIHNIYRFMKKYLKRKKYGKSLFASQCYLPFGCRGIPPSSRFPPQHRHPSPLLSFSLPITLTPRHVHKYTRLPPSFPHSQKNIRRHSHSLLPQNGKYDRLKNVLEPPVWFDQKVSENGCDKFNAVF